jgi:hypothetical protein
MAHPDLFKTDFWMARSWSSVLTHIKRTTTAKAPTITPMIEPAANAAIVEVIGKYSLRFNPHP